ncbi:MAG: GspE/PulE family protein [Verrucomicrobiota bacterium]
MNTENVLGLLVGTGFLTDDQAQDLRTDIANSGDSVIDELVRFGLFEDKEQFYATVADQLGVEHVDLGEFEPPKEILPVIPAGMARLHGALPVSVDEDGITVALVDPTDPQVLEELRFALGKEVTAVVGDSNRVLDLIDTSYGADSSGMDEILTQLGDGEFGGEGKELSAEELEAEANAAPIIRYVDLVIYQAIKERASDIHFEPFEADFKIRYRVDGALYEMAPPPAHLESAITSRIKVMANLNIAERRLPQDGRIMKTIQDRQVDLRVSTLPTSYGESVVLRVLDRSNVNMDLEQLGMEPDVYEVINETVLKPNGIFICTGPTGAGKTTTLYAALRKVNTIDSKLLTAEDPVEYDIEGIIQVPVNERIGLSFGRILRAFLRQDPDRILVGEMRDVETAQIAIQASLTGHLVLSTLHTNDAAGAVTRMTDMGVEPFLVAATLETVLGQRLIRTICEACRASYEPNESMLSQLGVSMSDLQGKDFYTGRGCAECNNTGYRGRKGLYELLELNDTLREMITERAPTVKLRHKAIELGMTTLREDGLRNIYDGTTTIEEVLKYT